MSAHASLPASIQPSEDASGGMGTVGWVLPFLPLFIRVLLMEPKPFLDSCSAESVIRSEFFTRSSAARRPIMVTKRASRRCLAVSLPGLDTGNGPGMCL